MIAKSDLIILVVSSTLLGLAIYRWDQNTRNVDTSTVLANTTVNAPANNANSSNNQTLTTTAVDTSASSINSGSTQYIDPQPAAAPAVVVVEPVVVETVSAFAVHTVRSGDSLSEIAARYNTTVNELKSINGISGSTIFIGQEIQYPNN